jgi:RNA polymerase sigma-B factor
MTVQGRIEQDPSANDGPRDDELFTAIAAHPDATTRAALVELVVRRHGWVVRWAAGLYRDRGESLEVLRQVGYVGLLEAIERFDPRRGADFDSFAVPTVLGEIRRHFRDRRRCTRIPRRLYHLQVRIREQAAALEQQLRRAPTVAELAAALKVPAEDVIEALAALSWLGPASLDEPTPSGTRVADLVGVEDSRLESLIDMQALSGLVAALPERERTILRMRFYDEMSQAQIAAELGISQMHVSRLLARTLHRLREALSGGGRVA